jgi:hypothetical protein
MGCLLCTDDLGNTRGDGFVGVTSVFDDEDDRLLMVREPMPKWLWPFSFLVVSFFVVLCFFCELMDEFEDEDEVL